jgi:uncharacterized protein (DUF924 family)
VTEKSNPSASERVLEFWFADGMTSAEALAQRSELWFGEDQRVAVDREIDRLFRSEVELAIAGGLGDWATTPRGRLALILLCDQFPRNVFRGTARAFAGDLRARQLSEEGLRSHAHIKLHPVERLFFYMPLEHAEDGAAQDRVATILEALMQEVPAEMRFFFDDCFAAAGRHREIIRRFGRFPHRNALLGRRSTAAEQEYLQKGSEDFGQRT